MSWVLDKVLILVGIQKWPGICNSVGGILGTRESGESCSVMSNSLWPHGLYSPWNSPGWNTRVGGLSLLQRIFPTQGSNPGLLHYRRVLYQLSPKGSPRILEWVAYPFSSRSSWPRNQTGSPALQVDSLPTELWGKPTRERWVNFQN